MNLQAWFKKRGLRFAYQRASSLVERYGIRPQKATARIQHSVQALEECGCKPTFFVPAVVVKRNLPFIRSLQDQGCEIGVHGYQHIDLKNVPPSEGSRQLLKAAVFLADNGLEVHGFRCPYLSSSEELMQELPAEVFRYSSNQAVSWEHTLPRPAGNSVLFETIKTFYQPVPAEGEFCLPGINRGMVEIPVCVPDDLQLHDGQQFSLVEIAETWISVLEKIHQRGELFNLMFHPELAARCEAPFMEVLQTANQPQYNIWVTQLKDVCAWWLEKETFSVTLEKAGGDTWLNLHCSPRAIVLYRNLELQPPGQPWDATYRILATRSVPLKDGHVPIIQLSAGLPVWVGDALKRKGYIFMPGVESQACSLIINQDFLQDIHNPVELERAIENSRTPLVRFWPWPDGQRSALCLTGDLDALSLADYATRLLPGS